MSISDSFIEIMKYAHVYNWLPDWEFAKEIYQAFPDAYSVLTPFAYAYLEEIIRSTTSEYGKEILDAEGKPIMRKVGIKLLNLAVKQNSDNLDYVAKLEKVVASKILCILRMSDNIEFALLGQG